MDYFQDLINENIVPPSKNELTLEQGKIYLVDDHYTFFKCNGSVLLQDMGNVIELGGVRLTLSEIHNTLITIEEYCSYGGLTKEFGECLITGGNVTFSGGKWVIFKDMYTKFVHDGLSWVKTNNEIELVPIKQTGDYHIFSNNQQCGVIKLKHSIALVNKRGFKHVKKIQTLSLTKIDTDYDQLLFNILDKLADHEKAITIPTDLLLENNTSPENLVSDKYKLDKNYFGDTEEHLIRIY